MPTEDTADGIYADGGFYILYTCGDVLFGDTEPKVEAGSYTPREK